MRLAECNSHMQYLRLLDKDPEEYNRLFNALSINVTEFFRDMVMFEIFKEIIFPNLAYNKIQRKGRIIRIWSAGCASGEEAYSIAISIAEAIKDRDRNFIVSIYGTDIDEAAMKQAKLGIYPKERLKNVNKQILKRYFNHKDGKYQVKDEIKSMIRFNKQDLIHDKHPTHFDIIFCRNVFIYFSRKQQDKLLNIFHSSLNSDGFLILGKTETIPIDLHEKFYFVDPGEKIYRKI